MEKSHSSQPAAKKIGAYTLVRKIGQGSFSEVFQAYDTLNSQKVAIKVISSQKIREHQLKKAIINEVKALKLTAEAFHVVKFLEYFHVDGNHCIVKELCDENLDQYMKKKKHISEDDSTRIITEILLGFKVLHSHNIVHRDVKPSNILLKNGVIKISDFGLCKILSNKDQVMKSLVGTLQYQAPQMTRDGRYRSNCDIYSLGVVFYKLLYGKHPYNSKSIFSLLQQFQTHDVVFPDQISVSDKNKQILKKMLNINAQQRATWQQVFNHFIPTKQSSQGTTQDRSSQRETYCESEATETTHKQSISDFDSDNVALMINIMKRHQSLMQMNNVALSAIKLGEFQFVELGKLCLSKIKRQLNTLISKVEGRAEFIQIYNTLKNNSKLLGQVLQPAIEPELRKKLVTKLIKSQINKILKKGVESQKQKAIILIKIIDLKNSGRFIKSDEKYDKLSDEQIISRLCQFYQ